MRFKFEVFSLTLHMNFMYTGYTTCDTTTLYMEFYFIIMKTEIQIECMLDVLVNYVKKDQTNAIQCHIYIGPNVLLACSVETLHW